MMINDKRRIVVKVGIITIPTHLLTWQESGLFLENNN